MDNTDDDIRYLGVAQGYGVSQRPKLPVRSASYSQQVGSQYVNGDDGNGDEDDEEEVDEEDDDDNNGDNGDNADRQMGKGQTDDEDDDDEDGDDENEDEDEDEDRENGYRKGIGDVDLEKHQKKRKLKSLLSSYEFAPRVAAPPVSDASTSKPSFGGRNSVAAPPVSDASTSKPSFGGRNSLADWTEDETFALLDAWGDRFIKHGRKSLRSEEWQEVAEKVNRNSKIERTDTQCRNRLDTLKKKYKKEKAKLAESRSMTGRWVYFSKMDMLMSSTTKQPGLLDSGEYVFMNPKASLNRANGLDKMKDSPGNSRSEEGEGDDSDGLPPKRTRKGRDRDDGASFRLLADSIHKFSNIYEKVENRKRQQMVELEKMRMDFHRDLELQKRQILERAQAKIAKLWQGEGEDEENDLSTENVSG